MKNYTREELLIDIRKKAARKRPEAGELIQGIVFAAINAQEYFESSSLLFSKGKPVPAYGLFIHGVEELGKIAYLSDILVSWKSPEKSFNYKNKQKDHSWKISGTLEMFSRFFDMKSVNMSFTGKIKSAIGEVEGEDIIKYFRDSLDPKLASKYHEQRLNATYTNFDGKRVSSPKNQMHNFSADNCEYVASLAGQVLAKLLKVCETGLPLYMVLVRKIYEETDPKKISTAKKEFNRRIDRTMPALRLYLDDLYKSETGLGLDELLDIYKKELPNILEGKGDIKLHMSKVAEIIKSHEKIDDVYFYPPLKDEAKEYYLSLIQPSKPFVKAQLKSRSKRKMKSNGKEND